MKRNCLLKRGLTTVRKGFGSFHSEDVEVLIRQSSSEYELPHIFTEMTQKLIERLELFKTKYPNSLERRIKLYQIDDEWTFLNHGAFGATLTCLQDEANSWRSLCESQPLRFYDRLLLPCIVHNLREMALYLNCPSDELLPLPNVTTGLNSILNSVDLRPNDEIICFSLTYGSTKKMLADLSVRTKAKVVVIPIALPLHSSSEIMTKLQHHLNPAKTKLVVIDQITSNTGLVLPYLEMAQLVKQLTRATVVIDAAHALLSQEVSIYSDINALNISSVCDFWITNGHKWLSTPKGCAFMWVSPNIRHRVRPAIISHGFASSSSSSGSSRYSDPSRLLSGFVWDGCRDYSALLTTASALHFWREWYPANCDSVISNGSQQKHLQK